MSGGSGDELMAEVADLADGFARKVSRLAGSDLYLRQGMMKCALREVVWALNEVFPDAKDEQADLLDLMAVLVRDKGKE